MSYFLRGSPTLIRWPMEVDHSFSVLDKHKKVLAWKSFSNYFYTNPSDRYPETWLQKIDEHRFLNFFVKQGKYAFMHHLIVARQALDIPCKFFLIG